MGSLFLSLFAAFAAALSSLFFRKNTDSLVKNGSANGYLLLFYFLSFVLSLFFYSDIWKLHINPIMLVLGASVGMLNAMLMILTSQALKQGPSGLTFAFLNASAIFPGLILFLLLGTGFGFSYSSLQFFGMVLVLFGLFLGTPRKSKDRPKASSQWLKYVLACFSVQIFALTFIQARCVLFNCSERIFSGYSVTEADDVWFMPGQFGAAFILQTVLFLREKKRLQKREIIYGSLGGIANFLSTCLLLLATKMALPLEKGVLFPLFAVACMISCNLWANRFYQENFNLKTTALCAFGIFLAASS